MQGYALRRSRSRWNTLQVSSGLKRLSGRVVISYSSGWLQKRNNRITYSVEGSDVHGLMECCYGVTERELDLVLHSPGGSAQAAEQILEYLRTRFDYIRAIVPLQAKSAATMIALGCDEIFMGAHSELGPIDPQIVVPVPEGSRFAPAHAICATLNVLKSNVSRMFPALLRGPRFSVLRWRTDRVLQSSNPAFHGSRGKLARKIHASPW